jgi:ferritin-like metal-binding protein YciE
MSKSKLKTLKDVLLDELRDLYSAETQLLKALPKMEKRATSKELKEAIKSHLEETEEQVNRLDKIAAIMDEKLTGKTCKAMKGLIEEGKELLEEESDNPSLIDALIIGAAQRVEHYEIAGYGTARAIAEALGEDKIASILQQTLDEESAADEKLSAISEEEVLVGALEGESSTGNVQESRRTL